MVVELLNTESLVVIKQSRCTNSLSNNRWSDKYQDYSYLLYYNSKLSSELQQVKNAVSKLDDRVRLLENNTQSTNAGSVSTQLYDIINETEELKKKAKTLFYLALKKTLSIPAPLLGLVSMQRMCYDIIILVQTWLTGDIGTAELNLHGYNVYRKDRNPTTSLHLRGGGVLIASQDHQILMGAVYFAPSSSIASYEEYSHNLLEVLNTLQPNGIVLTGDFNLPHIEWTNRADMPFLSHVGASTNEISAATAIADAISHLGLIQYNQERNYRGSLLDLVFTDRYEISVTCAEEILLNADVYHPVITFTKSSKFPVWFLHELELLIRRKKSVHRNFKLSNMLEDYLAFSHLRRACKSLAARCYTKYINNTENLITLDSKAFWKFIKSKNGDLNMPATMMLNGRTVSGESNIANSFANVFASTTTLPLRTTPTSSQSTNNRLKINGSLFPCTDIVITQGEIFNLINELPINKGPGEDDRLSAAFCNLIVEQQHGFMPKRSTVTNLCAFTQFVAKSLEDSIQVDVVYLDFHEAFDSIDHGILCNKLRELGMSDNLLRWMSSYLHRRFYSVKVGSSTSTSFCSTSGVPQGSHLGPLLFLLFVNDIANVILNAKFLLYADDIKLFIAVSSLHDAQNLQADLSRIESWCIGNNLGLNTNLFNGSPQQLKAQVISELERRIP
ncbi:uncharacterized protein LOC143374166 [Andrena cerasifolii]|uniref:uncharacterized protein LOC143374166 n=1 Tax=Andrena cerasifolii TaxID=2819439 RepID=UPI004038274F